MGYEEIQQVLVNIQHEISALRVSVESLQPGKTILTNAPPKAAEAPIDVVDEPKFAVEAPKAVVEAASNGQKAPVVGQVDATFADTSDSILNLLSTLSSSGVLEMVAGLLGGGKTSDIGSLLTGLLSQSDGQGQQLFDILGQISPEMRKVAKKVQGIWPLIELATKPKRGSAPTPEPELAQPQLYAAPQPMVRPAPRPVSQPTPRSAKAPNVIPPVIRTMEPPQTEVPQEWGAWTINRWSRR